MTGRGGLRRRQGGGAHPDISRVAEFFSGKERGPKKKEVKSIWLGPDFERRKGSGWEDIPPDEIHTCKGGDVQWALRRWVNLDGKI